jgi:hypothetical protein
MQRKLLVLPKNMDVIVMYFSPEMSLGVVRGITSGKDVRPNLPLNAASHLGRFIEQGIVLLGTGVVLDGDVELVAHFK